MAKTKGSKTLNDARAYYRLLLHEASGGTLGKEPDKVMLPANMTFAEKRGLLDSIIKVAQIEERFAEKEEPVSGLDMIRRSINDERRIAASGGSWRDEPDKGEPASDASAKPAEPAGGEDGSDLA